jgi:hypothetical protein
VVRQGGVKGQQFLIDGADSHKHRAHGELLGLSVGFDVSQGSGILRSIGGPVAPRDHRFSANFHP